jgi:hypothetical protein
MVVPETGFELMPLRRAVACVSRDVAKDASIWGPPFVREEFVGIAGR